MNLTLLTPPAFEPVSLDQVYGHLRLTPSGSPAAHPDDAMLTRHIATARREVERITHRALVRQQLRLSAWGFYGGDVRRIGFWTVPPSLPLLRPPLISVVSVQYHDEGNVLQTVATQDWYVTDDMVAQLRLVDSVSPVVRTRGDAVRVTYWAGYPANGSPAGTSRADLIANVPSECIDAILLGVELLYNPLSPEQRTALENAREALLSGLKVYGVA